MTPDTDDTLQETASTTQDTSAEKKTKYIRMPLKRLKFETGLAVLFVAMAAMVAMVILDVILSVHINVEGTLISNAFEAFKLIAVTVLGYIFGATNATAKEDS